MKTKLTLFFFLSLSFLHAQTINLDFPSVNGQVYAIAVDGNTLYIAGDFIEVDEIPRSNLAAIDLNTGALLDWDPQADERVDCIAVGDGVVYVCGDFQTINSTARNTLAALDATTGELTDWNPDIVFPGIPGMQTGRISGIGLFENTIFIGGYFLSVNGQSRSNLAALDVEGNIESFNPVLDVPMENIVIDDHIMYISGPFFNINGQEHLSFASFGLNALSLTSWNPMPNNPGNSNTVVFPQGEEVYIAGFFTSVGGTTREGVAKVDFNTGAVLPWEVNFINALPIVTSFAKWEDQLFMGGSYILDDPAGVGNLTAVNPETGDYADWWADPNSDIHTLLVAEQKLIVGGSFTNISSENKSGLAVYDLEFPNAVYEFSTIDIRVFPKPANELLHVQVSSDKVKSIGLYNINGVLLENYFINNQLELEITIKDLPSGLYNLVFRSKDGVVIKNDKIPLFRN